MQAKARVAVVDDHEDFLERVRQVLERAGYDVRAYSDPAVFRRAGAPPPPSCVLLDVEMPELSGLELQQALLEAGATAPLIFMSGLRDVPTTIQALKAGAIDFLLKPFTNDVLLAAVAKALGQSEAELAVRDRKRRAQEWLAILSPREREVCELVVNGLTSPLIAARIGISESTVSVHRARIMAKLGVSSIAELVRRVLETRP